MLLHIRDVHCRCGSCDEASARSPPARLAGPNKDPPELWRQTATTTTGPHGRRLPRRWYRQREQVIHQSGPGRDGPDQAGADAGGTSGWFNGPAVASTFESKARTALAPAFHLFFFLVVPRTVGRFVRWFVGAFFLSATVCGLDKPRPIIRFEGLESIFSLTWPANPVAVCAPGWVSAVQGLCARWVGASVHKTGKKGGQKLVQHAMAKDDYFWRQMTLEKVKAA